MIVNRLRNCLFQLWQILLDSIPDNFAIQIIVLMAEPVAEAAYIAPRQPWISRFSIFTEPDCGLADYQHHALDRGDSLAIIAECVEVHTSDEVFYQPDARVDIAQVREMIPKRQEWPLGLLFHGRVPSWILQARGRP